MHNEFIKKMWSKLMSESRKQLDSYKELIDDDKYNEFIVEIESIEKELQKESPDNKMLELRGGILAYLGEKL